ncbi:AAA family ATPase [Paractinoplanes brasiliensis]|uniref:AAA family ATPase n=1 Tax=Paractinoplanes brasiliensis TaxID=52695 RepID=UPI001AADE7C2|nr:AAA family ATPase [Actinoplanes brasiliensis]
MSLVRMGLNNYRCFAGSIDVELRPVTVVLGRNNSGKSALVRAPLVLSTGIDTDSPAPLDLDKVGRISSIPSPTSSTAVVRTGV